MYKKLHHFIIYQKFPANDGVRGLKLKAYPRVTAFRLDFQKVQMIV